MGKNVAEWSGHLAYALVLFSFLARSMLQLRFLSIAGSFAGLYYAYFNAAGTLWTPIIWNVLFVSVNAWRASNLMWQRRKQVLSDEEIFFSTHALKPFTASDLKSFVRLAERKAFLRDERLIQQGVVLQHLFLIARGNVAIHLNGKEIARLSAGSFLGEMSFLSHEMARADAVASADGELLAWSHVEIQGWTREDPERGSILQAALGSQIIELLMRKSV